MRDTMKPCPLCAGVTVKVIYMGLPLRLCGDDACGCLFGFWFWLVEILPFNGYLLKYDGSYPSALWYWLTNNNDNSDGL